MKRRLIVFLTVVLSSLLIVPSYNILSAPNRDAIKWKRSFFFNMDFASRWAARLLYPLGVSTNPEQVIIGMNDWLFLGDQYEKTRSVDRRPPTSAEIELGKRIGAATAAWDVFLASKGVKAFKIMIGPNKGTIYPEHMPIWAKPASPNATDALLAGTGTNQYIDLRSSLSSAKLNQREPLYYKTDTHWNLLGAGVAFRSFAQQVAKTEPEIVWPTEGVYELLRIDSRSGGDLSNFLRLSGYLRDSEPIIHAVDSPIETTQLDFDTQRIIRKGGNPQVGSRTQPLLVKSAGALNDKKVLWLRDSFGSAMSPLMAATFSEVLQLHWGEAIKPGGRFIELVGKWKPDYVFFTVVERDSRSPWFAGYPPPLLVATGGSYKPLFSTVRVSSNHVINGRSAIEYRINGNDPFIDFAISDAVTRSDANHIGIDLTCDDATPSVPLQLFWLEEGRTHYDEEHSVRLSFSTGRNLIDIRTIPKWGATGAISRLRVDIDARNSCGYFKLTNPSFVD